FTVTLNILHAAVDGDALGELSVALDPPDSSHRGVGAEVIDEFADAAVILEDLFAGLAAALVSDAQAQPGDQERGLPGTVHQLVFEEVCIGGEDLSVGPVSDSGAGDSAFGLSRDLKR